MSIATDTPRPAPHTAAYYEWQAHNPPDPSDPNDTTSTHGHCASFCIEEGPTRGASVQQHGLHCTSRHKSVEGHGDGDGASRLLFLYAEQPYRHGVIHRAEAWAINQRGARVCLELEGEDGIRPDEDDPERQRLYISPNEARGMARYLSWMADVADGLTDNPNTATCDRDAENAAPLEVSA